MAIEMESQMKRQIGWWWWWWVGEKIWKEGKACVWNNGSMPSCPHPKPRDGHSKSQADVKRIFNLKKRGDYLLIVNVI